MVSKKSVFFSELGKTDMVLGKRVAIFDWEWARKWAPRDGQKIPCIDILNVVTFDILLYR